ncbi:SIS domain-containing protein [Sphingobacterium sp. SG20118]|uniref:KpsF/GutQ family sugar-phosphate isomerase n=1 Tax=Sphingobacterium TaxID=28453 RepID=UPI0004F69590|nr:MULTISPECIES: KpsF/GutQ family sugar-phosphate isomerase [Sphingobacterium]AIM37726.1 D-arabinose 5-phosphate isomerase [Sphingobacterium sp. ML3W]MDH5826150.1 KpsF/GutQ family sugar-phosphate isomerase [Sphingobacterium faecium]
MKSNIDIKNIAIQAIQEEAKAVADLAQRIDDDFVNVVKHVINLQGRVIVTGIGKSAIIAQKIVATMNSTGTPSIFMHAADAIHGDLGIIQKQDLIIAISKSGTTPEIKVLVPFLKQTGNTLVALVGNINSYLADQADYVLDTTVEKEACPNNLAPTSSTTAQLAMGDALAVCLQECRDFSDKDFAKYHPGGALGKKLYLKVADLSDQNEKPKTQSNANIRSVILTITQSRLGAVAVLEQENIIGIITDGDIRRMLENHEDLTGLTAADIMGANPKTIDKSELAVNALHMMRQNNISQLIVMDANKYEGIIHIQDLLKEGII